MGSDANFDPWIDRINARFDRFEKELDKKFNLLMALIVFQWATTMLGLFAIYRRH